MELPAWIVVGSLRLHPHFVFESAAYLVGFQTFRVLRRRRGDLVPSTHRWWLVAAAILGAAVGSKVLYWLSDPDLTWSHRGNPEFLLGGKTIVGALLGGWIAVEAAKRRLRIGVATGDLYVFPLLLGIAIGRVGCFLTGLADNTHGLPTSLPWGVNYGDGIPRHPAQLYEIAFLALAAPVLGWAARRALAPGDLFKAFLVGYLSFRLLVEFLKPGEPLLGLTGIQWACLAALTFYASVFIRTLRTAGVVAHA